MGRSNLKFESRWARLAAAVALAIAAQLAGTLLAPPAPISMIVYAPFVVASAIAGGLGPGLVTTMLCCLEAAYFVMEPVGSLAVSNTKDFERLGGLLLTGAIASLFSERLKRSSRQLTEAHQKTTAVLDSISDGFNAFDRDWRYTYVNAAGARLLGKTPEELLGKNLWELWPLAADSPFGAAYRKAVAENIPLQVESFYGDPLNAWFEVRCYPSPQGLSVFYTDTTERRRAHLESRLLSSIVEGCDDAIISKDLDGMILSWNKSAERMYGYSAEEMVGQPIARLSPPGHEDEALEILEYLKLGERIDHMETERMRKDGQLIFVALTVSPLRDDEGRIVGASVIGHDVTERKRVARALEQSELRYRSLVRASSQIVWTTNARGEVVDDLPAWREFTGQSMEESGGWGWLEAVHPDDREPTAAVWSRAIETRSVYVTQYRLRRHDGEYRWMAVQGVPVMDERADVREWVGTCADITDRVQAEEEVHTLNLTLEKRVAERTAELKAANQELEAFAYSVSHDLRAPLRAVDGFSRILLEEHAPEVPQEARRYLGIVRENALQMGKLIDGLLAFSRLGRQALSKQDVAPGELVRQVLGDLASDQEGRQLDIRVGDLASCHADPFLLKQVFFNLLSNALKYTRKCEVGRIQVGCCVCADLGPQAMDASVRAGAPPDTPVYYVRDNGAGFDMRYAGKLFGVFQRLHRAEEYEGTGVGLATVLRIVSRHGGRVWAEGALNQGATFYFTLPAEGAAAEIVSEPAA
jgi:PAS domain S-box-containing protein